jgi:hypothetical protein
MKLKDAIFFNSIRIIFSIISICFFSISVFAQTNSTLKVVIIRHGEKPKTGDNLNCMGLNRSQLLPKVMVDKFGVPAFSYVPSVGADSASKHARMFQTITPLAVKYNLTINSKFNGKDSAGVANDIIKRKGTVLIVWDHKSIVPLVHAFGVTEGLLKWADDDFDSIWIITFNNGQVVLTKDKEGLKPLANCN